IAGCVVLVCFRLLGALVAFFMNDSSIISRQLFELFLRPSLYPGAVFPRGLKIFFMTALPTLLTSAVPIYILKGNSAQLLIFTILITLVWVLITYAVFRISIRRYESGNYLR
ncbi:MAG: ABC-2 family transporter protein, partial [Patescibacteria group bacterium]